MHQKRIFYLIVFLLVTTLAKAKVNVMMERDTILPQVFMIGEYEQVYDILLNEYETLLLSACNNNMTKAFNKWKGMLEAMEVYANEVDYDLYGVKLWVNVFWNKDGSFRHFAYYFKPLSKNMDIPEFNAFIESFINYYHFPFQYHEEFSHYGTAAFPLVPRVLLRK